MSSAKNQSTSIQRKIKFFQRYISWHEKRNLKVPKKYYTFVAKHK